MTRRILFQFLALVAVAVSAVGVTKAYFSDQGNSTGNTFAAGALDLRLSDNNETAKDNISASIGANGMIPGGSTATGYIQLRNSGNINANHAEVAVVNSCSVADMAKYLRLVTLTYDGSTDELGQIADANTNGYKDLEDWANANSGQGLDNLPLTDLGTNHELSMTVQLDASAPNAYQGQNCTTTFTATLNQDTSQ